MITLMLTKKKCLIRLTASLVITTFLCQNMAWALESNNTSKTVDQKKNTLASDSKIDEKYFEREYLIGLFGRQISKILNQNHNKNKNPKEKYNLVKQFFSDWVSRYKKHVKENSLSEEDIKISYDNHGVYTSVFGIVIFNPYYRDNASTETLASILETGKIVKIREEKKFSVYALEKEPVFTRERGIDKDSEEKPSRRRDYSRIKKFLPYIAIIVILAIEGYINYGTDVSHFFNNLFNRIQKIEMQVEKSKIIQRIDRSLMHEPRYVPITIEKLPSDFNTGIDLSRSKSAGIGKTFPYQAVAGESVVATVEGEVYTPLFKDIFFNFNENGELLAPDDLRFVPRGERIGGGVLNYRISSKGRTVFSPLTSLQSIVEAAKIVPISENGEPIEKEGIAFKLVNGRYIEFDYTGRVIIEVKLANYNGIGMEFTQRRLPENELNDFPQVFSEDIISYIRKKLSSDRELLGQFISQIDRESLSYREKLDLIEQAEFIPDWLKIQAIANIMNKYTLYNGSYAVMEYNGQSWGSTWDSIIASGRMIRLTCDTSGRMFVLLSQRLGVRAGYVPYDPIIRKSGYLIRSGVPHAMAVVEIDRKWQFVETTRLMRKEAGLVSSSGGIQFEGNSEKMEDSMVYSLEPDNIDEVNKLLERDSILLQIDEHIELYKDRAKSDYYWSELGGLYRELGEWDSAINAYKNAIGINSSGMYWYGIEEAYKGKGALDEGIEYAKGFLEDHPNIGGAWDTLLALYLEKDDIDKGVEYTREFLEDHPDTDGAWRVLHVLYSHKEVIGDQDIEYFRGFIKDHPTNPKAWDTLISFYSQRGNLDQAIEYARGFLRAYPSNVQAQNALKISYERQASEYFVKGDYDRAIGSLYNIIRIDPSNKFALAKLGECYKAKQEYDNAIVTYGKILIADQFNENALLEIGECYKLKGEPDKAKETYDKILQHNPHNDVALSRVAEYYRAKREYDKAIAAYRKIIEYNLSSGYVYNQIGECYEAMGDYPNAIASYKKDLENESSSKYSWGDLAGIYTKGKARLNEGVQYFRRLTIRYPNEESAFRMLARLYKAKGRFKEAELYYKKAVDIDPDSEEHLEELGDFYLERKRYDEAISTYGRVLRLEYYSRDVYLGLANVYLRKGEYGKAVSHCRDYLRQQIGYGWSGWKKLVDIYESIGHRKKAGLAAGFMYKNRSEPTTLEDLEDVFREFDSLIEVTLPQEGKQIKHSPSKDIGGRKTKHREEINPNLEGWLKQNREGVKVIDYYYEDGKWVAYMVEYKKDYSPEMVDKGEPVRDDKYQLSDEEQKRLNKTLQSCTYAEIGKPVRFRVVLDETAVAWQRDLDHSSLIHVGERTVTIWFGEGLFRDLLSKDEDALREKILNHEKYHLLGNHSVDEKFEYLDLVKEVHERCEEIDKRKRRSNFSKAIIERQKRVTERFMDIVKARLTKSKDRKTVLALDTDIGNMTQFEIDKLLKQIEDICNLLGDVEFVAGPGRKLHGSISDKIGELMNRKGIKREDIDVVVVTKRGKEEFDNSYHITRVDDAKLGKSRSYVPIIELLTFALRINLEEGDGILREELRRIYNEITEGVLTDDILGQIKRGVFAIPLPATEKISSDFYNESIEILHAA